jgi:hypothetical protein
MADENANVMNPDEWEQYPEPIFERNDAAGVFGPGHHGFFQSPDATEDWIVYHGKTSSQYTRHERTNRAQNFIWNAVLPAFQFHLGQNPTLELDANQASADWQFIVSVNGRSGAPLLASEWKQGPGKVRFNLAESLKAEGFDLNYTWSQDKDTLLAYVYNVKDHFEQNLWLAGRFHRKPQPTDLTLRIQNLPDRPLVLRIYTMNEQRLHTERTIIGEQTINIHQTSHDYVVTVTPQ